MQEEPQVKKRGRPRKNTSNSLDGSTETESRLSGTSASLQVQQKKVWKCLVIVLVLQIQNLSIRRIYCYKYIFVLFVCSLIFLIRWKICNFQQFYDTYVIIFFSFVKCRINFQESFWIQKVIIIPTLLWLAGEKSGWEKRTSICTCTKIWGLQSPHGPLQCLQGRWLSRWMSFTGWAMSATTRDIIFPFDTFQFLLSG